MIVNDAFQACSSAVIIEKLIELFPEEVSNILGYKEALDEIFYATEPVASDFQLEIKWYPMYDGSDELYLNTRCVKEDEEMGYSMMGMTWGQVLGAQVPKCMSDEFSNETIAANCLFGMTFMGYSNEAVQGEIDKVVGYKNDYLERHKDEE